MPESDSYYRAAERRIEILTLALGAAGTLYAAWRWGWRAGAGVALGAALAWVNYRWLKQGVDVLARLASAQPEAGKTRIPWTVYAKFFGRYALLVLIVCVILWRSFLPVAGVLGGFFALAAAVLVELGWQVMRGPRDAEPG